MHFILLLSLNLAHANFGASQDEMDLFDLGNDFLSIRTFLAPAFDDFWTAQFGLKSLTSHLGPKIRSIVKIGIVQKSFYSGRSEC